MSTKKKNKKEGKVVSREQFQEVLDKATYDAVVLATQLFELPVFFIHKTLLDAKENMLKSAEGRKILNGEAGRTVDMMTALVEAKRKLRPFFKDAPDLEDWDLKFAPREE